MLTSIIEPGTYMVRDKIFKAGDTIDLTAEEQTEMDAISQIFVEWNKARTDLLNKCHLTEEPFSVEMASLAHDMKIQNFTMRFRLNLLIAAVEKRLGGLLPIYYSSTNRQLVISVKAEESLVYTTKFIGDTIGMPAFDFPRTITSHLVGKERVYFDNARDEVLSCISTFGDVDSAQEAAWAKAGPSETLDDLVHAIETTLTNDGPTAMSLIVLWSAKGVRILNADAIPSTVDPSIRILWQLEKILKSEGNVRGVSIVSEKAEPAKISFAISHIIKDESPMGAEIIHTVGPEKATDVNLAATPSFAVTRMTPDAINDLLV